MCLREGFKKIILWGVEETELCGVEKGLRRKREREEEL